jgi:hypothetical protein
VKPDITVTLAAQLCREHGWSAGDTLIGRHDDPDAEAAFLLTAVGNERVLVVRMADRRRGRWFPVRDRYETTVNVFTRTMRKATSEESAAFA